MQTTGPALHGTPQRLQVGAGGAPSLPPRSGFRGHRDTPQCLADRAGVARPEQGGSERPPPPAPKHSPPTRSSHPLPPAPPLTAINNLTLPQPHVKRQVPTAQPHIPVAPRDGGAQLHVCRVPPHPEERGWQHPPASTPPCPLPARVLGCPSLKGAAPSASAAGNAWPPRCHSPSPAPCRAAERRQETPSEQLHQHHLHQQPPDPGCLRRTRTWDPFREEQTSPSSGCSDGAPFPGRLQALTMVALPPQCFTPNLAALCQPRPQRPLHLGRVQHTWRSQGNPSGLPQT